MTLIENPSSTRSGGSVPLGRRPLVDRRALAMPLLASLITVLVFAPFAPQEIDPHDGLMLKPALDVLSGQALFRDTMSQHGPLSTYLQVGFLALLGPRLLSIKIGAVVMYGLAAGLLAAAWGRLLPSSLTAFSLILWGALAHFYDGSTMYPWPSVDSLVFQAAALYFLLKSTPAAGMRSLAYPLLCGASAGLCYWCRWSVGLLLIAALMMSYVILACAAGERPWASRRLYAFIVGNVAVHFVFLAILVLTHATTDYIDQNYTFFAKMYASDTLTRLWHMVEVLLVPPAFRASFRSDPVRAILPLIVILASIATLALGFMGRFQPAPPKLPLDRGEGPSRSRPVAPAVVLVVLGLSVLMVMLCQPLPEAMKRRFDYRFMPREYWYFLIPYIVLAATAAVSAHWFLRRGRGVESFVSEPILPGYVAGLVALASWAQYYPWGDNIHGWWAMAPGIGVFAFFVLRLAPGRPLAITLALGVLMMPTVLQRSALAVETLLRPRVTLQNPPVFTGMRLLPKDAAALSPFLASLDDYIAKHPKTAMLINGGAAAIYLPLVPDLSNPSNIWWYDRFLPIPRADEIEARRREFIRDRRPLLVYYLDDDPTPSEQSTPYELEKQNRSIRVNRDRRANMEEILRDDHYVELAFARVAEGHASLILLGPRD